MAFTAIAKILEEYEYENFMGGSPLSLVPQSVLSASKLRHAPEAKDHVLEVFGLRGKTLTLPDTSYSPTAGLAQIRAFARRTVDIFYSRLMSDYRPVPLDDEELEHTSMGPYTIAILAACAYRCFNRTSKD